MTVVKEKGGRVTRAWSIRYCESQPKPYNRPLPYQAYGGTQSGYPNGRLDDIRNAVPLANGFHWNQGVARASNSALDKLYDQLGQAENLRVAWLERHKSLQMVTNRLRGLITMARAVKRRDPRIIRRVLKRNPKAKDVIKQPAGLWLEYWFGWQPLVADLHHALNVFGHEFPSQPLRASGGAVSIDEQPKGRYHFHRYEFRTRVKVGGEIFAIDPNVTLASSLGFAQPLSVAWEMTPFSWVVDYFVNVGDLLKNLEPRFPGIKTRNQYTTIFITMSGYRGEDAPGFESNLLTGFYMKRAGGWPSYKLEFSSPFDLSGQRCSYLASVFIQLLTSMKK